MKFLIPIVVGATIGYFTNWLAIKMLFRPHYEKKIMGITLPFTPGLIPKEKSRIAHTIGEAVGKHLLSPGTIAESLSSGKVDEDIRMWVKSKLDSLKNSDKSIKELLEDLSFDGYNDINLTIKQSLGSFISMEIKGEKFKNEILKFIEYKLNQDEFYVEIKEKIRILIYNFVDSKEIEELLQKSINKEFDKLSKDDRILKEALPDSVILGVDKYLSENIKKIAYNIRELISSPDIQQKLKLSITAIVEQNVSRLITSFITPEAISEKIFGAILDYINDEDSNKDINLIIKSSLDKFMEIQVSDILPRLVENMNPNEISKKILNYTINDEVKESMIDIIDGKLRMSDKKEIVNKISKTLENLLDSEDMNIRIISFIEDMIDNLMDKKLSVLMKNPHQNFSKLYDFSKTIFDSFAQNELTHIIELFNVSKIVEDNINKFEVEFTEELILDIASKELKTITWLGALLGGIMGLLSPLLQML